MNYDDKMNINMNINDKTKDVIFLKSLKTLF